MTRKTGPSIVATVALALVFALCPAGASAEDAPAVSLPSYPVLFSSTTSEQSVVYAGSFNFTCEAHTTSGEFINPTTGWIKLRFEECEDDIFNNDCTTSGKTSGVIETDFLTFHTVYLEPANAEEPHETPGIVMTPNEGTSRFAEFKCNEEELKVVIEGNGLLGTILDPEIGGEESNTVTISVSATEEGQQHTQTVSAQSFGAEVSYNGKEPEPAYVQSGTDALDVAGEAKATLSTVIEPNETQAPEAAPAVDLPSYPTDFTSTGGVNIFYAGSSAVQCESSASEGEFLSSQIGWMRLTLKGCKSSGVSCTSRGHAVGTIVFERLTVHTAYLKPENAEEQHERPGVLLTPGHVTGNFAVFYCAFGLVKNVVGGNGLLGTITEPGFEEAFNTVTLGIEATEEGQQHTETVEEQEFGAEVSINGSEPLPFYLSHGSIGLTLGSEAEGILTTEPESP